MRQPAAVRPLMTENPQLMLEREIRHNRLVDHVARLHAAEAAFRRARGDERPLEPRRRRYYFEGRAYELTMEC